VGSIAADTVRLLRAAGWQADLDQFGRISTNATIEAQHAAVQGAIAGAPRRDTGTERYPQMLTPKSKPKRKARVTTIHRKRNAALSRLEPARKRAIKAHGTKRWNTEREKLRRATDRAEKLTLELNRLRQLGGVTETIDAHRARFDADRKRKAGPGKTKSGRKRRPLTGDAKRAFLARMKADRAGR